MLNWLFGTDYRVDYDLQQSGDISAHGAPMANDFDNYGDLKNAVAHLLADFACPACGNRMVSGSGILVKYGRVHLFRQESYTGWLGGTKYKEVHYQTVWRVHDVVLQQKSGLPIIGTDAGQMKCHASGCAWHLDGGLAPGGIEWLAIKDLPDHFARAFRRGG